MSEVKELWAKLAPYGFKDKHGHPIENCVDFLAIFNELTTSKEKLERAQVLLHQVADGLERVRYPGSGDSGGREWVSDLGLYLRGDAAAILCVEPEVMRTLEARLAGEKPS